MYVEDRAGLIGGLCLSCGTPPALLLYAAPVWYGLVVYIINIELKQHVVVCHVM